MATLSQKPLFGWDQIEALGELKRLQLVLENLPEESVVKKLEQERDRGRDRYPIRPMCNALIAGIVFQHPTVESLLGELRRNAQIRQVCGFDLLKDLKAVPNSWAFWRFLAKLILHLPLLEVMFHALVERLTGRRWRATREARARRSTWTVGETATGNGGLTSTVVLTRTELPGSR